MEYYCRKKQIVLFGKKAQKKCINTNLRKRGRVCPHLCEREVGDEASVYPLSEAVWLLQPGK